MNQFTKPPRFRFRPDEEWAELAPGYLLSSRGRLYSLKSRKLIKPRKNNSGYYRYEVWNGGIRARVFVHIKVVAIFGDRFGKKLEFDSLFPHGLSIDHVDRNKRNNRQENLELVPHAENCRRKYYDCFENLPFD